MPPVSSIFESFSALWRGTLIWAFTVVYWTYHLGRYAIRLKRVPLEDAQAIARGWGKGGLRLAGIRLVYENPSPFADHVEPRLIIANHPSALDLLWGSVICPPRPFAIGKKELIFVPVINWVWWMLRFARIDRKDRARAIASLESVPARILRDRLSLLMAPEGTRSHDGGIGPFKKGPFYVAIAAQIPIYPIVAKGAYALMPRTAWFPKKGEIRVRFLPPIPTKGMREEDVDALAERCRTEMLKA